MISIQCRMGEAVRASQSASGVPNSIISGMEMPLKPSEVATESQSP